MDNLAQILFTEFPRQPDFVNITDYFFQEVTKRKAGKESIFGKMPFDEARCLALDVLLYYAEFRRKALEAKRIQAHDQTLAWYEVTLFKQRYIQIEKGELDIHI